MDEWAFIGREANLATLAELVGAGRSVVITGEAGSGKSRLLHEFGQRIERSGGTPVRLVATATAASIPFGALAPLVTLDDRSRAPVDVLAAAHASVRERLSGESGLLLVDDAPRLDAGSATFLHQVVIDGVCPVVVTARQGETTPDAVTALIAEPSVTLIDLEPLDDRTIERLAERVLGGQCGAGVVHVLGRLSGGNPLSLRELIHQGRSHGWLAETGGVWRVVDEVGAPPRLQELVASRLATLSPSARSGMEVLACVERIELDQISKLVGDDDLEQLESQGLLSVEIDAQRPMVVLAHPLYGEAVRGSLSTLRRRRIATELAAVVEAAGFASVGAVTRVVQWRLDAGVEVDPGLIADAAREAWMANDFDLAEQLAATARERGAGFEAGLILGESAMLTGRHEVAEHVLAALDTGSLDADQLARLANARAFNLAQNLDREDDALDVLEATLVRVGGGEHGDLIRGRVVGIHAMAPRPRRALDLASPLLTEGGREFYRAAFAASIALATVGRLDDAVAMGQKGFEAHDRVREAARQLPESQHVGPILALIAAGNLAEAARLADEGRRRSAASLDDESQATFALLDGMVATTAGRLADAVRHHREAAAINTELGDRPALRWALAGVCLSAAMAGDRAGAASALSHLDTVPATGVRLLDALLVDRSRAWERIVRHDLVGAADVLRQAADAAAASEQRVAEAFLLHDLVDVDRRVDDAARLARVAEGIDGPLIAAMAAHAGALVDRDADRLEEAAHAFGDLGVAIHAAIAASQAARELAARGYDRRSRAMAALATTMLTTCQGADPPLLAERAVPVALTRREREIATLAADGWSNREISERLYLSVRTVENHLQRAYEKLGVTSRTDLSSALESGAVGTHL